jgi:hypothetical protein
MINTLKYCKKLLNDKKRKSTVETWREERKVFAFDLKENKGKTFSKNRISGPVRTKK